MSYKNSLGIEKEEEIPESEDRSIFSKEIDDYFLSVGFYEDYMNPRFMNSSYYPKLEHDERCLRFDGDWDHDNHGVQRVFMNKNEIYVERQTSYRSFDSASHHKFDSPPSSIEEIESWLDELVAKYEL